MKIIPSTIYLPSTKYTHTTIPLKKIHFKIGEARNKPASLCRLFTYLFSYYCVCWNLISPHPLLCTVIRVLTMQDLHWMNLCKYVFFKKYCCPFLISLFSNRTRHLIFLSNVPELLYRWGIWCQENRNMRGVAARGGKPDGTLQRCSARQAQCFTKILASFSC